MTETEILRSMLDERGVEWKAPMSFDGTARYDTTAGGYWFHEFNGKITIHGLIPEQAIAATLGSFNCTNSERTNETCLPHFWTHDGTLHVELPKLPESISVRLPAQRDREVGSARVW